MTEQLERKYTDYSMINKIIDDHDDDYYSDAIMTSGHIDGDVFNIFLVGQVLHIPYISCV